jgi:hypothetical protein
VGAEYIEKLKHLIEETVNATGQRARLISHSMGCLQILYLLNRQSQEWKDHFVEKWIPMSGPYGGSVKELRVHASGDNQGLPISSLSIREEQRSYETNFWLAPMPERFGKDVLVSTPTRNYTGQDLDVFFEDIGYPAGKKLYKRVLPLTSKVEAPGVDVVCMYSLGVDTPSQFIYDNEGFDKTPTIINGNGDGTVNEVSLRLCEQWNGKQSRPVKVKKFSKVTHSGMLSDEGVLKHIMDELGMSTDKVVLV